MSAATVGCVGLGNMGGALAENLVGAGLTVVAYDAAGPDRAPEGSTPAGSVAEVARQADVIVLSLPDGTVSEKVAREIVDTDGRRVRHVIDTSTVGVPAARTVAGALADGGVGHVDAPVSGGPAGARARTLAVMYSGTDEACAAVAAVLAGLSDRTHRVGAESGMAQALKLANNFLSATALAATSEAIAFGRSAGLDMATMLEVLNGASGRSGATIDKFPAHVVTEKYASGFSNSLMSKDVQLYLSGVGESGSPSEIGTVTASLWQRFAESQPDADFTRIYPFVASPEAGTESR